MKRAVLYLRVSTLDQTTAHECVPLHTRRTPALAKGRYRGTHYRRHIFPSIRPGVIAGGASFPSTKQ
jgi:DNA invertase Pin-like site-specific DNA recombinase